ncbi:hypothetical protein C8R43DRAFT_1125842 [Mycena crocata]|nr:hypothetical protein C8R43DRAFT_1125842 [Mycena crocata]
MGTLQFDSNFWEDKLGDIPTKSLNTKLGLILSLIIYLSVSIRHLLTFIFTSEIQSAKDRADRFLGYTPTHTDPHAGTDPVDDYTALPIACTGEEDAVKPAENATNQIELP